MKDEIKQAANNVKTLVKEHPALFALATGVTGYAVGGIVMKIDMTDRRTLLLGLRPDQAQLLLTGGTEAVFPLPERDIVVFVNSGA